MRSRVIVATSSIGLALAIAACGGGGSAGPGGQPGGPGGGNGVDPGATPMRTVIVNQESDPAQTYPLEGGRYRVAWSSSDCPDGIVISINKVDILPSLPHPSPYEYEKPTDIPAFNTLLQRVPAGVYTFQQTEESCATWEIRSDRVGN